MFGSHRAAFNQQQEEVPAQHRQRLGRAPFYIQVVAFRERAHAYKVGHVVERRVEKLDDAAHFSWTDPLEVDDAKDLKGIQLVVA